jgi:hypothetical protein
MILTGSEGSKAFYNSVQFDEFTMVKPALENEN